MHRPMLLALAPMKDVTDLAFLNTLKDLNSLPDYFITEYFRTVAHHKRCRHTFCTPLMKILQAAPFTDSSWAMNRNTWQGMRRS